MGETTRVPRYKRGLAMQLAVTQVPTEVKEYYERVAEERHTSLSVEVRNAVTYCYAHDTEFEPMKIYGKRPSKINFRVWREVDEYFRDLAYRHDTLRSQEFAGALIYVYEHKIRFKAKWLKVEIPEVEK